MLLVVLTVVAGRILYCFPAVVVSFHFVVPVSALMSGETQSCYMYPTDNGSCICRMPFSLSAIVVSYDYLPGAETLMAQKFSSDIALLHNGFSADLVPNGTPSTGRGLFPPAGLLLLTVLYAMCRPLYWLNVNCEQCCDVWMIMP